MKSDLEYLLDAMGAGSLVCAEHLYAAIERRKQDLAKADAALLYTNREKLYMDTPQNVPNTADNTPKGGGEVKRPEHATAQSVTQAQTLRSDINIPCSCGPGDCNKRILAHNEYCTEDRRAFEVEEDLLLDRRVYGTSFHKIVNGKKVRVHPRDVRIINDMPKDSSNTECIASKTEAKDEAASALDALLAERDALSAHDSQCIKDRVAYCEEIEELEAAVERLTAERDAARAEILELHEKVSFLESREVCAAAHDDVETCGYCQRDAARAELKEAVERSAQLEELLTMMYDKWEDGTPCYEDPEDCTGELGNAFRLTLEEENKVLALIPKERSLDRVGKQPSGEE